MVTLTYTIVFQNNDVTWPAMLSKLPNGPLGGSVSSWGYPHSWMVYNGKYHLVGGWAAPLINISQLGLLFPIYGKKCSKPPTSHYIKNGWELGVHPWRNGNIHMFMVFMVVADVVSSKDIQYLHVLAIRNQHWYMGFIFAVDGQNPAPAGNYW